MVGVEGRVEFGLQAGVGRWVGEEEVEGGVEERGDGVGAGEAVRLSRGGGKWCGLGGEEMERKGRAYNWMQISCLSASPSRPCAMKDWSMSPLGLASGWRRWAMSLFAWLAG